MLWNRIDPFLINTGAFVRGRSKQFSDYKNALDYCANELMRNVARKTVPPQLRLKQQKFRKVSDID